MCDAGGDELCFPDLLPTHPARPLALKLITRNDTPLLLTEPQHQAQVLSSSSDVSHWLLTRTVFCLQLPWLYSLCSMLHSRLFSRLVSRLYTSLHGRARVKVKPSIVACKP